MPDPKYDVLLTGKTLPDFPPEQVAAELARIFKMPPAKVAALLEGKPRRIKSGVSKDMAEKYVRHLSNIGAECLHRPCSPKPAAAGAASAATANTTAAPKSSAKPADKTPTLSQDSLRGAFSGDIANGATARGYSVAMVGVALFMLIMPLVYLLLTLGVAVGTWWYGVSNLDLITETPRLGSIMLWGIPVFAGIVLVFFMVKPVLHSIHPQHKGISINLDKHPLLATFIREIVHKTGAPMPVEVRLDMDVNAYAGPLKGFGSLSRKELVLGIGMPLIAGLNTRQLAGILGHEFGHFAQQNGMQANYMIGSINSWFSRCVYMRDAWDERLDEWYEKYDDQRGWFIMVAKLGVWLGRKILGLFLILSAVVSRNLSRQMEFDADRYECGIAGSKTFEQSAKRLLELSVGQQLAIDELQHAWQDGRLSDDLIPAVIRHSQALPTEYQDYIRHALAERSTSIHDTHPSDGERIEAARKLEAAGVFPLELPASVLIRDFPGMCKMLTRDMYEKEWELQFSDAQLTSADDVAEQTRERDENEACLNTYLGALFQPARIIVPEPVKNDVEAATVAETLRQLIPQLRDKIPVYEQMMKKLEQVEGRMADVFKGRMLLQNDVPIAAAEFHLPEASIEVADAAWANARTELAEVRKAIAPVEQLIARRLGLEFRLILKDANDATVSEYNTLVATLKGLARIDEALENFFIHAATLDQLLHTMSEGRDISDKILDQDVKQCVEDYTRILKLLGDAPYPFARGDNITTLREHLIDCAGDPDAIRVQFARVWQSYCCVRDVHQQLNRRIMSRLARMAQDLEDKLHVPHLKVTDNPKQATA